jgi:hypothetical protein
MDFNFFLIPMYMVSGAILSGVGYEITKWATKKKDPFEGLVKTGSETVKLELNDGLFCDIDVEFKYYPWDEEKIILLRRFLTENERESGYGYKK